MDNVKYLTPKKPLSEIARERAEAAEQQNIDIYEAIAGLFEDMAALTEKTLLSQSVLLNLKEDKQNEN